MKIRKWILLVTALALVGCGQPKNAEPKVEKDKVSESVEPKDEKVTESAGTKETSQASESASAEEEAYVLTFESTSITGEIITDACLADSKLIMINIWGTYCNPCIAEMPDLAEIAASYDPAEFQLIGIIADVQEGASEASLANAQAIIDQTGANYTHLLLSESLYVNLVGATDAVPTTFFVNQKGEVLGYIVGANSKETWVEVIEDLLAKQ